MSIIPFERSTIVLDKERLSSLRFAEFLEEITRQINSNIIQSDTGSPEGVLVASPNTLYMDESGGSGSILYIKQTGTGNTGWILV